MVTEAMKNEHADVKRRFEYQADSGMDRWRIHKTDGSIVGDCEDFSLTLLWQLAGRSTWRFWWLLLTCQAAIWHVKSYTDEPHAILWYRGWWADNMEPTWYQKNEMRHTLRFPWVMPFPILKILLAKII